VSETADSKSSPLHREMVRQNLASEEEIYSRLAEFLRLPYRSCQITELDLELISRFPRDMIIEYSAVPFAEDASTLIILTSNPFRIEDISRFKYYTDKKLRCELITETSANLLIRYSENKFRQSSVLFDYSKRAADIANAEKSDIAIDAPVITLCDSILSDAVQRGASDVHIEPLSGAVKIRFRIDGMLVRIEELSLGLFPAVLARFKIMSGLNIAERRVPQDGKIRKALNGVPYDFRVSTMPTVHGEKLVIRIYNVALENASLDMLGFSKPQRELIIKLITRPHGILLLTGPTGSGKSTTLYSFLRYLNTEDKNIITVEDPVENEIPGINQVQVNPKANLTFATALRSILRQDPDIIMIGEIRDEETAEIATRAAITGHLVLSTIHTNDVSGVITRLINMGIPKYLVSDSLLGAISQRLLRVLCPKCKAPHTATAAETARLGIKKPTTIYSPVGCPYCNGTGYFGRTGVFEMMVVDDSIREAVMSDSYTSELIAELLQKKSSTIMQNAALRVLGGDTSMEELQKLSPTIEE